MNSNEKKLCELLPSIYRIRDIKEQGGQLRELFSVIASQIDLLDENLAQLYDDMFIETCAEWVIPYIGDLIGYRSLHNLPNISQRAEVANTIGYRRRKGTASMLEQLARDVTGWNAHVVEFYHLLATTQYMNHIRLDNKTTPDLRQWEMLEYLDTPFDRVPHTVDMRRIESKRGKFNIPNIGIFLWRLGSYSLIDSPACIKDEGRYFFSPLGNDTELFTRPETEKNVTHLATRMNVPMPISRRLLKEYLSDYYGEEKSFLIQIGKNNGKYQEIPGDRIEISDLSDIEDGKWAHDPPEDVIEFLFNWDDVPGIDDNKLKSNLKDFIGMNWVENAQITKTKKDDKEIINVSTLNHSCEIVRENEKVVLHTNNDMIELILEGSKILYLSVKAKVAVDPVFGRIAFPMTIPQNLKPDNNDVKVTFRYGFSTDIGGGEYSRASSFNNEQNNLPQHFSVPSDKYSNIQEALDDFKTSGVIEINNSGRYEETLKIQIGSDKIILQGADKKRPTIIMNDNMEVNGDDDSELTLNGLLISGGAIHVLNKTNKLSILRIIHCTLVPGISLDGDALNRQKPSIIIESTGTVLEIKDSIVGGIRVAEGASVRITNSIVDSVSESNIAYSDVDIKKPGGEMVLKNCTIIGKVNTTNMVEVSNTIFASNEPVIVEKQQEGCVRFSYLPLNSKVPRRHYCHDKSEGIYPIFSSMKYGDADYCQLSLSCSNLIRQGADDEAEMGAFHDLYQPQREINLRVRLDEYLRFGMEAGIFYSVNKSKNFTQGGII